MTAAQWKSRILAVVGACRAGDPAPLGILSNQLAELEEWAELAKTAPPIQAPELKKVNQQPLVEIDPYVMGPEEQREE